MSTAVALLSGKGGSGKTTLALSMADLLCRCEARTLLVDCDLSTNGATFFFESQLHEWNKDRQNCISSFYDILNLKESFVDPIPLKIKNKLDFIPSISNVLDRNFKMEEKRYSITTYLLSEFIYWARNNYDVILFDCQAGYSEFLPSLLPMIDADLFVLEADSISASAMRSLHLKIGGLFGHARLYQVFNKATPEEFEIYSKIVGTFFTNIGTLLFDWKIRQAFSRSQIPDMENTSAQYGSDLCNVCKIIFPEKVVQKGIDSFSAQMYYLQLENEHKEIDKKLNDLTKRHSFVTRRILLVPLLSITLLTIATGVFILFDVNRIPVDVITTIIYPILISMILLSIIPEFWPERNSDRRKRKEYELTLMRIDRELVKLGKKIEKSVSSQRDNAG